MAEGTKKGDCLPSEALVTSACTLSRTLCGEEPGSLMALASAFANISGPRPDGSVVVWFGMAEEAIRVFLTGENVYRPSARSGLERLASRITILVPAPRSSSFDNNKRTETLFWLGA